MRKYAMVDKATGEAIEVDTDTAERVTGVEVDYIDWLLEQDAKFENVDWVALVSQRSW